MPRPTLFVLNHLFPTIICIWTVSHLRLTPIILGVGTTHARLKKKLKSTIFLFTNFCAMNDHRKHCLFNTKPGGSHHKNTPLPPTGEVFLPVYLFQHHQQAKIKPDLFCKTRWASPAQVRSSSPPSPVRHPVHSGSKRPDRESRNNTTPGRC